MGDNWIQKFGGDLKSQAGAMIAPMVMDLAIRFLVPKIEDVVVDLVDDLKDLIEKQKAKASETDGALDDVGMAAAEANLPFTLSALDGGLEWVRAWAAVKLAEAKQTPTKTDDYAFEAVVAILGAVDSALDRVRG